MTTHYYVDPSKGAPGVQVPLGHDGRPQRKAVQRRVIDPAGPIIRSLESRVYDDGEGRRSEQELPTRGSMLPMKAPQSYDNELGSAGTSKFVHASASKYKSPLNVISWTPDGRRVLTGSASGQFTVWNGQSFNFENLLPAHERPIRAFGWSKSDVWLLSADDSGTVKVFKSVINNVKAVQAHQMPVYAVSFCPTDLKFVTGSADTSLKVFDFARCKEDVKLTSHGGDVRCAEWHPTHSLIVSGSKDWHAKLWDPRQGSDSIATLHGHTGVLSNVRWNANGYWLATSGRDGQVKLFDIRTLKELGKLSGHYRAATSLAWHPRHEECLTSSGSDGSIYNWVVGWDRPVTEVARAHDNPVHSVSWHPLGHLLASGSADCSVKFWCRPRPGEYPKDALTSRLSAPNPHSKPNQQQQQQQQSQAPSVPPGLAPYQHQQPPQPPQPPPFPSRPS